MSSGISQSPGEDYFNNFPQHSNEHHYDSRSPPEVPSVASNIDGGHNGTPRPKRIACVVCRKRKLRCDGGKPSCGTCTRLAHDCAYDEVRRKSGPKRGYVKQLEARLAQVETLLQTQDPNERPADVPATAHLKSGQSTIPERAEFDDDGNDIDFGMGGQDTEHDTVNPSEPFNAAPTRPSPTVFNPLNHLRFGGDDSFTWELIGQGLDEPLPRQEVIDELHHIYFEKIHPSVPMIHRARYFAAMNLAPHMRPPICLRYAIWCLASSITEKYSSLQDHFYQRARKYAESDEMKGHGEAFITIAHSQTWTLVATYEFKLMYFPRAWMSTGRAIRLAQMMGLHRLDGVGLDVKQCLLPPRDWTEREERRRTFWMAFCEDRYASIGTGWPVLIDEKDILTNLPASEEAFSRCKPQRTLSLVESMSTEGAAKLSSFAGVCLMACLFGRNLTHLHRPDPNDRDDDLNGEFWKRHRNLDNILLNTSLSLPSHLRLPAGVANSNIVFLNMNIHTSTICLHQAAIFKADKNRLPPSIASESKTRCILAAAEIASIMRMVSHLDVSTMNPFIAFCLYVAARVFVQYLKSRPEDQSVRASLDFLLSAMRALKHTNPLTESFLVQLDVDLEGSGMDDPNNNSRFAFSMKKGVAEVPSGTGNVLCSTVFEIRQSQPLGATIPPSNDSISGRPPLQTTSGSPMDFNNVTNTDYRATLLNLPNRQKAAHGGSQAIPVNLHGVMSGYDHGERMADGDFMHKMDMDLSSNNGSSEHHSSSNHPTPSTTSHKGSSRTSYSPPQTDEAPATQYHTIIANGPSPNAAAFFDSDNNFTDYSPGAQQFLAPTPGQDNDGAFVIPPGWDLQGGHTGMTPDRQTGAALDLQTGLMPFGDDGWGNMLDDLG
ncbi:MAG: hypothetical protein M1830_000701 [Pleopsidium flavum]|nr:MAG: hypothetical protein M1830_000701 [Pleopsidium flavum]